MKLRRRKFLRLAAGAVAFPSLLHFASAFDYPTSGTFDRRLSARRHRRHDGAGWFAFL
jgi:hypothetical protein